MTENITEIGFREGNKMEGIEEKNTVYFLTQKEAEEFTKKHNIKVYKFYTPLYTEKGVILAWN